MDVLKREKNLKKSSTFNLMLLSSVKFYVEDFFKFFVFLRRSNFYFLYTEKLLLCRKKVRLSFLCVDHVIWTGREMLKLVLNIKTLLCFQCFCEMHFWASSKSRKGLVISLKKCRTISPSFQSSKTQKSK